MIALQLPNANGSPSLGKLCAHLGVSRSGYYDYLRRLRVRQEQEAEVLKLVDGIRRLQSRAGTRKMYEELRDRIPFGRDAFFDLLRRTGRLIWPRKRYVHTTNSNHWYRRWKNLIKDTKPERPDQVLVGDITYLRLRNGGFCYASLLTDLYSRKIVGYHVAENLNHTGPLTALKMALKQVSDPGGMIHHSDRGIQYCCGPYVELLQKNGVRISMTEDNHCYENAVAERVNGILKNEFYLDLPFDSLKQAREALKQSVWIYNNKRKHFSLKLKTPNEVHEQKQITRSLF